MSIATLQPIIRDEPSVSRIDGTISRLDRRGRQLYTFEGAGLCKTGHGEVATVSFDGKTYRGDLVAISPSRAILHVSSSRADHGIV